MRIFKPGPAPICLVLLLACCARDGFGDDLADGYRHARDLVSQRLSDVQLNSVYGTPAFDAAGRRIDDVFLNFCGRDVEGRWMLMSLTLGPNDVLTGEDDENNPRPDEWGHHLKPAIDLPSWLAPEEAVPLAIRLHPGHEPMAGLSLAYYTSSDFGGRAVIVLYWLRESVIYDVVLDAKYGETLRVGQTPWPYRRRPLLPPDFVSGRACAGSPRPRSRLAYPPG